MYETTIWERYYVIRRLVQYFQQYSNSLMFKISSPLSSVFWIISSIVGQEWALELKLLAVFTLIGPAVYFYIMYRPFNVKINWNQLRPNGKITQRANFRNRIFIDGENNEAEVRVTVLFDKSVDSYSLQFDSDYPLETYPGTSAPNNSKYDEDSNILYADDVDNVRFVMIYSDTD